MDAGNDGMSGGNAGRREFIKIGTTGAVFGALAGYSISSFKVDGVGDLVDPEALFIENWQEPWTWRPELWPDKPLNLNVVHNQNPGHSPSPGNPTPLIFSYNGASPGPTVRVRSDGEVKFRVRNTLPRNDQETIVGMAPDVAEFYEPFRMELCSLVEEQVRGGDPENPRRCGPFFFPEQVLQMVDLETRIGWNMGGHVNGQHGSHTTNLHTHGLHVHPQANPDGTHSDNVLLRIIPNADWESRQAIGVGLGHWEYVGQLDYKMTLSYVKDGKSIPHPPGTHWYHPHSHGATHDQVASGMAGFLIVEGDVDDNINKAMTGQTFPDPEHKTGPYDYRERLIFIQRVFVPPTDFDEGKKGGAKRFTPPVAVNGVQGPTVIRMRPGTVERWRVLNGSVDGAGTKRFMVLDGQFVQKGQKMYRVTSSGEGRDKKRQMTEVSMRELEDAKLDLHQLSTDGITRVVVKDGEALHEILDLSKQNAGTENPFTTPARRGESETQARLRGISDMFRDGDSLRRAFVRPNEVYMTNANRADVFFKAPVDSAGRIFTIFAQEAHIHSDLLEFVLHERVQRPDRGPRRPIFDVVVAYIHVDGDPVEGGDFDIQTLNAHMPEVPSLLQPVEASELEVPEAEAAVTGVTPGSKRTRTLSYSGIGGAEFPLVELPEGFAEQHADKENNLWADIEGVKVLMPNLTRTMAINTEFDLTVNPEPMIPRKFGHDDPYRSRMLVNTAEEWVVYNSAMTLWSHTDLEQFPQPGSWRGHFTAYPIHRAEGVRRFNENPEFSITNRGIDHPFHIHVNPMWVIRIDVPDEHGNLHNILPEPLWMDTVAIPRNGGRIVFRSRFDDFVGKWVNHCHLLLHEDMGMMQMVECTDQASEVNYHPRETVAGHDMPAAEVDAIYPRASLEQMYVQNMTFIDPSDIAYQEYPGFEIPIPKLEDE